MPFNILRLGFTKMPSEKWLLNTFSKPCRLYKYHKIRDFGRFGKDWTNKLFSRLLVGDISMVESSFSSCFHPVFPSYLLYERLSFQKIATQWLTSIFDSLTNNIFILKSKCIFYFQWWKYYKCCFFLFFYCNVVICKSLYIFLFCHLMAVLFLL